MSWDAVGVLINLATIIFAAGGLVWSVTNVGKRMTGLEAEMKQMVAVLVTQARQDERMNAMDERVLSQGKRLDAFMRSQTEAQERMARMVENTISRVNQIADRGLKHDGS